MTSISGWKPLLLDAKSNAYLPSLPSLRLNDVRITPEIVKEYERMLTGGFYAEVMPGYDASIAREKGARPFGVVALRAIELSLCAGCPTGRRPRLARTSFPCSCAVSMQPSLALHRYLRGPALY